MIEKEELEICESIFKTFGEYEFIEEKLRVSEHNTKFICVLLSESKFNKRMFVN